MEPGIEYIQSLLCNNHPKTLWYETRTVSLMVLELDWTQLDCSLLEFFVWSFIPISKTSDAKECSNYCTIAIISNASNVMLKILQQYMN